MSEPLFPVDLVSPDGVAFQASTNAELVQLVYGEGYRLRRAAPGFEGIAVVQPERAAEPREVTSWRGMPAAAETDADPSPELVAEPGPSRSRKTSRKA